MSEKQYTVELSSVQLILIIETLELYLQVAKKDESINVDDEELLLAKLKSILD